MGEVRYKRKLSHPIREIVTKERAVQQEIKKEKWNDIGRAEQCCRVICRAALEFKEESIQDVKMETSRPKGWWRSEADQDEKGETKKCI